MTLSSIRACLVQLEVQAGHPVSNTERMLTHIGRAREDGAELIVFPEMAIPGYLIGDEWEHEAFLRECEHCADEVRQASRGTTVVFGSVGLDWDRRNEDGRVRKYNALFVADDGEFVGPGGSLYPFVVKTLLPNYREFDDSRHFFDLRKLALEEGKSLDEFVAPVQTRKLSLGCVLCEDAWDMDYSVSPLARLARHHSPDIYVNISASPFTANKNHKRHRVFSAQAETLGRPLVYVNKVGIQNNGKTVFTFDGASCIYDGHGHVTGCGGRFAESSPVVDIPLGENAGFGEPIDLRDDGIDVICDAILYGTRRFMELCGVKRVTVGVSGGIDSSVVAALYSLILPREDLLLVNMPSRYNSPTTRSLAKQLADNLGCYYAEVPIEESGAVTHAQLDGVPVRGLSADLADRELKLSGLLKENIQARDRSARVLAAISAAFGGVFTCNGNKSEMTVGYATLYGDLAGYFANLSDLWKTEVYALARHLNANVFRREVIPRGSIELVPSAELSDAQNVDEGKGDPLVYPYHDCLFRSWVEWWNRTTPEELLDWYREGTLAEKIGYDGDVSELFDSPAAFIADLERWWTLYTGMGLAKRIQAPPVLAVKRRAFGFDHRESQMGVRYTRRYLELKDELLGDGRRS